jgi:uncharacterized cupredoxin-like copper-binding protein
MKKKVFAVVEVLLLVVIFIVIQQALTNPATTVNVKLSEFKVNMSTTVVPANTPIKFVISNSGAVVHEAVLEDVDVVDEALEVNGEAYEADNINLGETRSVTWLVDQAGLYKLACHKAGHFEGGMFQNFKVVPPGSLELVSTFSWMMVGVSAIAFFVLGYFIVRPTAPKPVLA